LCAAFHAPEPGDRYIDDREHYRLAEVTRELTTEDEGETWILRSGTEVRTSRLDAE
jgi:hypothetical protein